MSIPGYIKSLCRINKIYLAPDGLRLAAGAPPLHPAGDFRLPDPLLLSYHSSQISVKYALDSSGPMQPCIRRLDRIPSWRDNVHAGINYYGVAENIATDAVVTAIAAAMMR